jgi:putative addiction module component (TIGR02574 family)
MDAELIAAVKALPRDEKVRLIGEVWASLDDSFEPPLTSAQAAELDRRLSFLRSNPNATASWEEVDAKAQRLIAATKNGQR